MTEVFVNNIAAFMPNAPVSNDEMEAVLGQVGDRPSRARRVILRRNGIKNRYYAVNPATGEPTHTNAELAAEAVRGLVNERFALDDIDCLACATTIADQLMPSHAVMVHGELGTPPCEVISTNGVCVSGITAMKYAWMGIATGEFSHAVAAASEFSSTAMRGYRFLPEVAARVDALEKNPEIGFEKDFLRWMLSDGAAAMLLEPEPNANGPSLRVDWIFERSYASEQSACMYSGAIKQPDGRLKGWSRFQPQEWLDHSVFAVQQDVKQLNEYIMHYTIERPLLELAEKRNVRPGDYDWFLPHYSSMYFRDRVHEAMRAADFEIPQDRWFTNLATKGNTGAAAIYIIVEELFHSGRLRDGQKLLCYVPESGRFSSAFLQLTVFDPATRGT